MKTAAIALAALLLGALAPSQTPVFFSDFDAAVPPEIQAGTAQLTGVQGYAGLGMTGDQFGGSFLRSETGNTVRLVLTGLPPHNAISLDFLFAAIDSLDGTGSFPAGDFFRVTLDGVPILRESFANATPQQIQSYVPPPGVQLARRVDLGFSGPGSYYTDSAYDLGSDPVFSLIPHQGSSATFAFVIEGQGIQSLGDESWAMDRVAVHVQTLVLGSVSAYGTSCGPVLSASSAPRIGHAANFVLDAEPAATVQSSLAIGVSNTNLGFFTLPWNLDFLGFTGCWLEQDLALSSGLPMTRVPLPARFSLLIPNDPTLVGAVFFAQGWSYAPGVNPGGIVFSGGLRVSIGQ
ncbi:MAG: hypothetical protein IT457_00530 [Planctomycetes bacterium]|nr:hypothetical protein [Planctomycetota bacterium]